ncbi:hypothetical protein M3Y98_00122400 [Aphelenchoides besseyi]|nr:hypothetical protein M3Y98_00122400 [Aphelenchoides besseyi]KAI6199522.1 hypothetical protein M3Y96_00636200 [Aphelenchoides besseyi]
MFGTASSSVLHRSTRRSNFSPIIFVFLLTIGHGVMCFGLSEQPLMSGRHDSNGRSSQWVMMPMENVMHEPQPLNANRMMMKLIGDAATPSAPTARPSSQWRMNGHGNRNLAWERLGFGW